MALLAFKALSYVPGAGYFPHSAVACLGSKHVFKMRLALQFHGNDRTEESLPPHPPHTSVAIFGGLHARFEASSHSDLGGFDFLFSKLTKRDCLSKLWIYAHAKEVCIGL